MCGLGFWFLLGFLPPPPRGSLSPPFGGLLLPPLGRPLSPPLKHLPPPLLIGITHPLVGNPPTSLIEDGFPLRSWYDFSIPKCFFLVGS